MKREAGMVLCASLMVACGGPDTKAVDTFGQELAAAACGWEFRCCTDAEIKQRDDGKFSDLATCEKFALLALDDGQISPWAPLYLEKLGIKEGRLKIDAAKEQACLAELNKMACNPAPGTPPPTTPPTTECPAADACTQVFVGAAQAGDACMLAQECVTGTHCLLGGSGTEGVCVPYQQENEICNNSIDCDPSVCNLYCAQQDWKCHVRSPLGGPCAYTIDPTTMMPRLPLLLECDKGVPGIYCDPDSKTCKQLPMAGAPCLSPLPPDTFTGCDPDPTLALICDTSMGKPGVCRGPGMVGDNCTAVSCATNLYCDHTVTPPACKAAPTLGESCNTTGFCQPPYYCNTSMSPFTCAQPGQLGTTCSFTMSCDTGLYCDMTVAMPTCKTKLTNGSACTQGDQCVSGICNFTGTMQVCQAGVTGVQCIGRM
jgi:hypothetical protein